MALWCYFGALMRHCDLSLHHAVAIDTQLIADAGGTGLWPNDCPQILLQGSAVLLISLKIMMNEKLRFLFQQQFQPLSWLRTSPLFWGQCQYIYPFIAGWWFFDRWTSLWYL